MEDEENPYQSPRAAGSPDALSRRSLWRFVPMACCAAIAVFNLFMGVIGTLDEYINIKHGSKTFVDVIAVAALTFMLTASAVVATRQWYRRKYRSALLFTLIAISPLYFVIDFAVRHGTLY